MTKLILIISISAILCTVFILLCVIRTEVNNKYRNRIYSVDTVPASKICLIPGASIWGDKPSHVLEDRLLVGIELYKKGKVEKLIVSGDHGHTSYDEVNVMKQFVLSHGVNEHDIFMDHAGFRTYDSCYRARDVFGVKKLIIASNSFHLPRALYIASGLGLDASGVPSDLRVYADAGKNAFREFFAQYKAFLDIKLFKPLPRYLGPRIDINGSGVVTQD
ncbi:MAG: YdcF family protein [Spirochaetales bacterium]|nr:YdcF family protein [Spirochaetales bacterium]